MSVPTHQCAAVVLVELVEVGGGAGRGPPGEGPGPGGALRLLGIHPLLQRGLSASVSSIGSGLAPGLPCRWAGGHWGPCRGAALGTTRCLHRPAPAQALAPLTASGPYCLPPPQPPAPPSPSPKIPQPGRCYDLTLAFLGQPARPTAAPCLGLLCTAVPCRPAL
jgi:hypothetical protein